MGETRIVDRRMAPADAQPATGARANGSSPSPIDVLEHVGAARAPVASPRTRISSTIASSSSWLLEEVLGGAADRLEDRVAAAQVALGEGARSRAAAPAEHGRELTGDVDQDGHLVCVPLARPRCC